MTDKPRPTVRVSLGSASLLAAATAAAGTLNTALASFLLGKPFGVGPDDVRAELTRVRNAGVAAISAAAEASESEAELDLDRVAAAAFDTVEGALRLALRSVEVVRRAGVGPWTDGELEGLQETVEAIAELLPGRGQEPGRQPSGAMAGRNR